MYNPAPGFGRGLKQYIIMRSTTIKVGDRDLPLYKTMRAQVDAERDGIGADELQSGNIEPLMKFIFYLVRGACIRDKVDFDMNFDEFIDHVEPDAINKLSELNKSEEASGDDSEDKKKG